MGQHREYLTWIRGTRGVLGNELLLLLGGLQDLKAAEQALVDAHHGAGIIEFAAVVRRAEEGDELTLAEELVPILHHLVGTANEVHVVLLQEARHHVRAEGEGHAAVVLAPTRNVLVRVRP